MYDWHRMLIFAHEAAIIPKDPKQVCFHFFEFPNLQIFLRFAAQMVVVAQLVRALDCGSRGRGFEPRHPPIFFQLLIFFHNSPGYIPLTSL